MLQVAVNKKVSDIEKKDEQLWLNGNLVQLDVSPQSNGLISVIYNNKSFTAIVEEIDRSAKQIVLSIDGQKFTASISEQIDILLHKMGINAKASGKLSAVKAPMPGMIIKVLVQPGQAVVKGDGLIVLEAMKMENILKATGNGTVKSVKVEERTAVEKGAVLIELD